jgi:Haem-binding domain/Cytochrome P460
MKAMASGNSFKTFVTVVAIFFVAFVCIQFIRPRLDNPPVTAELQAPPEVKQVFKNSCYSCHSNETKLPWFDQVVPAYWLVTRDVKEARSHLNFSEIAKLPAAQQKGILFEAVNQIQLGAMPLPSYLRVHPGAAVTAEELAVLRNYLAPPTPDTATAAPDVAAADDQYTKWIGAGATQLQVSPEPNGVAFLPDYKNWKLVSSTDRFDNHTMREILGNDIAIKAIADHHINPWPDGTAFAKVTWKEQPDGTGFVQTGAFVQVELMIRDGKKYASAAGWGWGRWRGTDFKPYGKSAAFTNECVSCHTPVRQNDYVYTMPLKGQQ